MAKFGKGQSGNPGGRPKVIGEIRDLARAHTDGAIATLVEIMRDTVASPAARVSAAMAILDRGWGKAPQDISLTAHAGIMMGLGDRLDRARERLKMHREASDSSAALPSPLCS